MLVALSAWARPPIPMDDAGTDAGSADAGALPDAGWSLLALPTIEVMPVQQTEATTQVGDAVIWLHPTRLEKSLIFSGAKRDGVLTFDLSGKKLGALGAGDLRTLDLRYNFPLKGDRVPLLAGVDRQSSTLKVFTVDTATGVLRSIAARELTVSLSAFSNLYRSSKSGRFYAFVGGEGGLLLQYELFEVDKGVDLKVVRILPQLGVVQSIAADDEQGRAYASAHDVGMYAFDPEPESSGEPTVVEPAGFDTHLSANTEGIHLYRGADGSGYIVIADQDRNSYAVFRREGLNEYITDFKTVPSASVDATEDASHFEVLSFPLPGYPSGVLVLQDKNTAGTSPPLESYKFVDWRDVAQAVVPPLTMTSVDPRLEGSGTSPPASGSCSVTSVTAAPWVLVAALALRGRKGRRQ
jgi:3-phytase